MQFLNEQSNRVNVEVKKKIPFSKLNLWSFKKDKSILIHDTGKIFSIEGINIKTNWGNINEWSQPIINQPEIGYLGFITKEFNGVLHFYYKPKSSLEM